MPEPRSSESSTPLSWSEWKAQNGSRRWYWRIPLKVEWALELFVHRLRGLALFDLLELAGKLTVLVAVVFWFLEADDRAKERHYRAWDLINAARGSTGDGGRRDALQDLNKDGISLAAAPLEQAYLPHIDLKGADLPHVNLKGADLGFASLQGAKLYGANLQGAKLWNANLDNADLRFANFNAADLGFFGKKATVAVGRLPAGPGLTEPGASPAGRQPLGRQPRGRQPRGRQPLGHRPLGRQPYGCQPRGRQPQDLPPHPGATGRGRRRRAHAAPADLTRPAHWSKTEGRQSPPAAQPDDAREAPATAGAPGSDK